MSVRPVRVAFLGHLVTASGVRTLPDRVEAIWNVPVPENKQELQRFLGIVNFYSFLERVGWKTWPTGFAYCWQGQTIEWMEPCAAAFVATKTALTSATLLQHPNPDLQWL